MRFKRREPLSDYNWTKRKESSYLRSNERAAARVTRDYPLFSGEFAPPPLLDVDSEKARRARDLERRERDWRDMTARHWRNARKAYFSCSSEVRRIIMAEWRTWPGPLEGCYFSYVVRKHNGDLAKLDAKNRAERAARKARLVALDLAQPVLFSPA